MPFELIITSLVGLFSGVISLYTDPKDKKHKIWQFILLALIIVSAGSTVYFGYHKEQESKATEARKDSQIKNLSDNLSQVNKQNSELLQTVNTMQLELRETGSDTKFIRATVIVSATFGHLQDSSLEPTTLKPCPIWITPYWGGRPFCLSGRNDD